MKPYLVRSKENSRESRNSRYKEQLLPLLSGRTSPVLRVEIQITLKRTVNGSGVAVFLHWQNLLEITSLELVEIIFKM